MWLLYNYLHVFLQILFNFSVCLSFKQWGFTMEPCLEAWKASGCNQFYAFESPFSCGQNQCFLLLVSAPVTKPVPRTAVCFVRTSQVNHSSSLPWPFHVGFLDGNKFDTWKDIRLRFWTQGRVLLFVTLTPTSPLVEFLPCHFYLQSKAPEIDTRACSSTFSLGRSLRKSASIPVSTNTSLGDSPLNSVTVSACYRHSWKTWERFLQATVATFLWNV